MQTISSNLVMANQTEIKSTPVHAPLIGTARSADTPREAQNKTSESEIKQSIKVANAALKSISSSLEFSQDASTGRSLVRIIDTSTNEVIRQFPTEEMLSISRAIDGFKGVLIHQKA